MGNRTKNNDRASSKPLSLKSPGDKPGSFKPYGAKQPATKSHTTKRHDNKHYGSKPSAYKLAASKKALAAASPDELSSDNQFSESLFSDKPPQRRSPAKPYSNRSSQNRSSQNGSSQRVPQNGAPQNKAPKSSPPSNRPYRDKKPPHESVASAQLRAKLIQENVRIAKFLADAGIASRRDSENLILAGLVEVNGTKITSPALNVTDNDIIKVSGEIVHRSKEIRLWAFYKPSLVITTHKDPKGRETVFEILPPYLKRVISVGRLDYNSEGLLLLTNSGDLARKLELPSSNLEREYRVRIIGELTPSIVDILANGVTIDGIKYRGIEIIDDTYDKTSKNYWVTITLREGKNREIRRVLEHFDIKVSRLIRVRYGSIKLDDMKPGEVREIRNLEI